MVTQIRRGSRGHLYLREWREHKGITADIMGGSLGYARESIYRIERDQSRARKNQLAYADRLGVDPGDLFNMPPANPDETAPPVMDSLDAIVKDAPDDTKALVADLVRRLVPKAR